MVIGSGRPGPGAITQCQNPCQNQAATTNASGRNREGSVLRASKFARRRLNLESAGLLLAALVFIGSSHYGEWLQPLDHLIYDAVIARTPAPMRDDVVLVTIDDQSLATYGPWPWPRDLQARLIGAITQHDPATLALDIVYANPSREAAADANLLAAAARSERLALPMMIDALAYDQQYIEVLPFPDLLAATDIIGHVQTEVDEDAIVRGTHLYQGLGNAHWPHLMLAIAEAVDGFARPSRCTQPGISHLSIAECDYVRLPFAGPPGTYASVSAHLLLAPGAVTPQIIDQALRDRIVLVGVTALGAGDWVASPLGYGTSPLSGVEFNANLFSALTLNQLIYPAPEMLTLLLASLLAGVSCLVLPRLQPKSALVTSLLMALLPIAVSVLTLVWLQRYLPLANATLAAVLIYPLWSWRRHEIAWAFIQGEFGRVDAEEQRWHFGSDSGALPEHSADALTAQGRLHKQLSRVLDTTLSQAEDGTWRPAKSLSHAEHSLLTAAVSAEPITPATQRLPTERLAARIEALERRTRVLRGARNLALAGLDQLSSGTLMISALGEPLFVNRTARMWLNWDNQQDALDQLQQIQTPLGQSWTDIWRLTVFDLKSVAFETQLVVSPGTEPVPAFVSAAPLLEEFSAPSSTATSSHSSNQTSNQTSSSQDTYAAAWVITLSDLSEVRTAQAQREEALAFLSHDLRSPLTSILALLEQRGSDDELLQNIKAYTQRGLSTSEQFLQLSRLQLQQHFETYPLDLEQVMHNAVEHSYFLAQAKHIRMSTALHIEDPELSPDAGVWVTGNGELLERALVNLLGNAIKYSDTETEVQVNLTVTTTEARVDVVDAGFGIPAAELELIFTPYFRSSAPRLANQRGAGLGLRFVKTVLDRHHGQVQVRSTEGQGSCFSVILPRGGD